MVAGASVVAVGLVGGGDGGAAGAVAAAGPAGRCTVVAVRRVVEVAGGRVVDVVEEEVAVVDGVWKTTGTTAPMPWAVEVVSALASSVRRMAGSWWRVGTPAMATPMAAQTTSMTAVIQR